MKEIREFREEIGELVKTLKRFELIMARNRGPFELFGIFVKDEDIGKWDLLVAADWIEADKKKSLRYIIEMLVKGLSKEELKRISRVVLVKEGDQVYEVLSRAIGRARNTEIYNTVFYGWNIKYAYIITWQRKRMGKKVSRKE